MKRPVVALVMLMVGVVLGATAYALPNENSPHGTIREGGVFRVSMWQVDHIDPALAYLPQSWSLLQATCAKLMNYPDKPSPAGLRAVPDVAVGSPRISPNGRVYTFTLRRGFRFSNGARLDARSFAREIERVRQLRSEGGLQYVEDIARADANGRRLTIRLTRPLPDFTARLAMPFFCAVPPRLPADPEGAKAYGSAGPYYVAEYRPGQRLVLRENRFYGGKRPHNVDRIEVDIVSGAEALERFERGGADWAVPDPAVFASRARELTRQYGPSGRPSLRPSPAMWFYALNTARPLFRNNARLRRAINFAVDRRKLVDQFGYRAARPTDQYLPIGFPGYREARIYPFRPNVKKARALARGRLRSGKAVLYTPNRTLAMSLAQVVQANLAKIGLKVEIQPFPLGTHFDKVQTRGEPFDIAFAPWLTDYNDPYAFINVLLDGRRIAPKNNTNLSYFNSAKYNGRMARASQRVGAARYRVYAKLEHQLVRDAAPMVALATANELTLVSARLDPRCKILNPGLDLAAVCLKR
jgi:peptide/nickel transport system substrate-binding protein